MSYQIGLIVVLVIGFLGLGFMQALGLRHLRQLRKDLQQAQARPQAAEMEAEPQAADEPELPFYGQSTRL